jgi:hypothetical protein
MDRIGVKNLKSRGLKIGGYVWIPNDYKKEE